MLSRLRRSAESLDMACLRALGHPHDHAIREELLDSLEWDASHHPHHARPLIRELFKHVHDHSTDLASRVRSNAADPDGAVQLIIVGIPGLRLRLAALIQGLAARHDETHVS